MISYEDLCAALAAYRARTRGEPMPSTSHHTTAIDVGSDLPPVEASLRSSGGGDDSTHVGNLTAGMDPVYDDRSNELDINDVLSDEEAL
jgi:hypothetical protein